MVYITSPIYRTRSYEQRELLRGPIDGTSAGVCRKRCWGFFFFFFASPDIYFSHLSCFAPTTVAYPLDDALASVVFAMPTIGPLGYVLCPLLATWLTPSLQNHQVLHGPSRPQIWTVINSHDPTVFQIPTTVASGGRQKLSFASNISVCSPHFSHAFSLIRFSFLYSVVRSTGSCTPRQHMTICISLPSHSNEFSSTNSAAAKFSLDYIVGDESVS